MEFGGITGFGHSDGHFSSRIRAVPGRVHPAVAPQRGIADIWQRLLQRPVLWLALLLSSGLLGVLDAVALVCMIVASQRLKLGLFGLLSYVGLRAIKPRGLPP